MKAKRIFIILACCAFSFLACILIARFDSVSDAAAALSQEPAYCPVGADWFIKLGCSAELAKACILDEYTPDMMLKLGMVQSDSNPRRAEYLLNMALSQTAVGIDPRSRFNILMALADLSRKQKDYDLAQKYVYAAKALRCKDPFSSSSEDIANCCWVLSDVARDQHHLQEADQLMDEAIQAEYRNFPNSPCMQENLAVLLEHRAELQTMQQQNEAATMLKKRAKLAREAARRNVISELEQPFIKAANDKFTKAMIAAGIDPETGVDKNQSVSDNTKRFPAPSRELLQEISGIQLPAVGVFPLGKPASGVQADGVRFTSVNLEERASTYNPFSTARGLIQTNDIGSYTVDRAGDLFSYHAQYEMITLIKKGTIEKIQCVAPEVWWACRGMTLDSRNKTLLAVSGADGPTAFFQKKLGSDEPWTAMASLTDQGLKGAIGLFFDRKGNLCTFEKDNNDRLTALVQLSEDGTVKKKTELSRQLPTRGDFSRFGLVCFNDKIAFILPEGVPQPNGENHRAGAWVLNTGGQLLAEVPFASGYDPGDAPPSVTEELAAASNR